MSTATVLCLASSSPWVSVTLLRSANGSSVGPPPHASLAPHELFDIFPGHSDSPFLCGTGFGFDEQSQPLDALFNVLLCHVADGEPDGVLAAALWIEI